MRVADHLAERLVSLGVEHVFGVGGANIEDVFSAVQRRRPMIRAVLAKHEHAAGTAADAYGRLRGLGVVLATSGGGAMNLVHALAEACSSSVPVLAIVGEPPTELQGRGAFQDSSGRGGTIDGEAVFRAAARRCFRVRDARSFPALLEHALDALAADPPGPAVLLVAKDVQRAETGVGAMGEPRARRAGRRASVELVRGAAARASAGPSVILAGPQVARAHATLALAELAARLGAGVAVTPDAKDAIDNDDPHYLGVVGPMGHAPVVDALRAADTVIAVGTDLPLLARQGLEPLLAEKPLITLGVAAPFLSGKGEPLHVDAPVDDALDALVSALGRKPPARTPKRHVRDAAPSAPFGATVALETLSRALPRGAIVIVDAGNTGATAVHAVDVPRGGRWLLAMGMAGMGYTFGAATGAAIATGRRCVVIAGDGAFFMQGLEIHTAVEHALPITYVLLDNRAHGMCVVRERLLLGEDGGYNTFRRSHVAAGLMAMFPSLRGGVASTAAALEALLRASFEEAGPSVISVELEAIEVPPFAPLRVAGDAPIRIQEVGP